MLEKSTKPIKGSELAQNLKVSRQVIVQDIALIRAKGKDIIATPQGYIIYSKDNTVEHHIKCKNHKDTQELYDELGYTEDVKQFLKYNADRALMNLGLDTIFEVSREDVNPLVMNGLSTETSNHDFFSQVGNGYEMGIVEAMKEEDYDIVKEMLNKKK